jgi:hypothetical protein
MARPIITHQIQQGVLKVEDNNVGIVLEDLDIPGSPRKTYTITNGASVTTLVISDPTAFPADGITDEVLLAILLDRASDRATGQARGRENGIVRQKLEEAMFWMHYTRMI